MHRDMEERRFTLIEVLMVIGIIAILVGMLMSAVPSAMDRARNISCMSNMRQLAHIYLMYSHEHKDFFPNLNNLAGGKNSFGESINMKNWLDDVIAQSLGPLQGSSGAYQVLHCPSGDKDGVYTTNYGLNYLIATDSQGSKRSVAHTRPDATALLVENYGHLCYYCYATNPAKKFVDGSDYANNRAAAFRHKRGTNCNVAFLDGHIEAVVTTQIPCKESYPDATEIQLRNTYFNSGKYDMTKPTISGK